MNNPLVSVCIPTYNNARYIGKTLESVLKQTYKNIEIIVSDNASTDNTEEIVKSFSDKRIRYYKNPETIVCLANWNQAIKLADGQYVAIYHSDDIYEPMIVEKEVKFLESYPEAGAVFSLDLIINENDNLIGRGVVLPEEIKNKDILNFPDLFRTMLKRSGSFLVAPTFMARREVFNNVGFFLEDDKFGDSVGSAADTEMWLRISQSYQIGIVKERLILRRISTTQGSGQYESTRTARANHFRVLDSFLENPEIKKQIDIKTLSQYEFNKFWDDIIIAKNLVKIGRCEEARALLFKIFSIDKLEFSFASFKNFAKLMIYVFFLIATILNISDFGIKCFRFIKRKKLWS